MPNNQSAQGKFTEMTKLTAGHTLKELVGKSGMTLQDLAKVVDMIRGKAPPPSGCQELAARVSELEEKLAASLQNNK